MAAMSAGRPSPRVAETGITSLSEQLLDLGKSTATVGTLIIRIATLWFGVVLGLIMFAVLMRRLDKQGKHLEALSEPTLAADAEAG